MGSAPEVALRDDPDGHGTRVRNRRRWWRWLAALCLVAVVSALGYALLFRPPSLPAPYQGANTASDELVQIVPDPTGGVWAIGDHYDRPLQVGVPGGTLLSTFLLHLEGGSWVKRYVVPSYAEGVGALAMTSSSEGWLVGARDLRSAGFVVHYTSGSVTSTNVPRGLFAVAMLSASDGWAVGNQGSIMHYTGGVWTMAASPTAAQLWSVAMVSPTEGWAVGHNGTILHYVDGGWSQVPSPTTAILESIAMISSADGWAVGENGTILHYSQGKWVQVESPVGASLNTVSMVSPNEGWAVGDWSSHSSIILHYASGVWSQVNSPSAEQLYSVTALSPSDVWAVGGHGTILHYTGAGWSVVNGPK